MKTKKLPSFNPNAFSRIASGTEIIGGQIRTSCEIRFDGTYIGNIESTSRVIIGENASIKGDIVCENLDIWGKLEGNVTVKDTMTLRSEAAFSGSVVSGRLVVEMGANFHGDNHPYTPEAAAGSETETTEEKTDKEK